MTELERARAHLKSEQEVLAARRLLAEGAPFPDEWEPSVRNAENGVLAALSWVWEEQEIERTRRRLASAMPTTLRKIQVYEYPLW
jgi:hypothetical protein